MTGETDRYIDPEIRTSEFFRGDQEQIAASLKGKQIAVPGSDRRITLEELQPWVKAEIKPPFKRLKELSAGEFTAHGYRSTTMSHIITRDRDTGEEGTCIAILGAGLFDPKTREFVPAKSLGEIGKYLGMERNGVAQLRFQDESDTLYLIGANPEALEQAPTTSVEMTPNEFIDGLVQGIDI